MGEENVSFPLFTAFHLKKAPNKRWLELGKHLGGITGSN